MTIKKRELVTCLHNHNDCPFVGRPVRFSTKVGRPLKKYKGIDQLLIFFADLGKPITRTDLKNHFSCRSPELSAHLETLIETGEIQLVDVRLNIRGPAAKAYEYIRGKKNE